MCGQISPLDHLPLKFMGAGTPLLCLGLASSSDAAQAFNLARSPAPEVCVGRPLDGL